MRIVTALLLFVSFVFAQGTEPYFGVTDPLLRKLVEKGVLTVEEARQASDQAHLLQLLLKKGVLTAAEVREIAPSMAIVAEPVLLASISAYPVLPSNIERTLAPTPPVVSIVPKPVIPAVTPLRVLSVDPIRRDGMVPDIKLGSGARLKPYGFLKASMIFDSSSPSGTDMPLPYLNGDTGSSMAPEFHVRARNFRVGSQFEWLDFSPKWSMTGRFEADFEGSFSRALNRNISTIRSSMFSLRTAWGRVDYNVNENTSIFFKVGQDWTPFGSSTIPDLVETTGLGLGYGTLYERVPLALAGVRHSLGGSRHLTLQPEFAVTMPAFGNTPANVADQEGYGERQGADSGRPEIQGRFVTQWQWDKAPAVAPAQFIVSFVQAGRKALIRAADVPAAYKSAFPNGGEVSSGRYGYTIELQTPTRYFTWQGKYFNGKDLRFYFVGGLYSNYNDTAGLTGVATGPSIDGASNVAFGLQGGVPVIAPQRAVRTQGFNTDLSFPFSRIFNASPSGRNAGWTTNFHYSIDMVPARDARRMSGVRGKSDLAAFTLFYRLNALVTWQFEQSMYRTRAANNSASEQGGLFLLRGIPSRQWHDIRSELGLLFTF